MRLEPTELTDAERALQREVREFLAERLPRGSYVPGLGMAAAHDRAFSQELGARGWLGMALPVEHGGGGRSFVERFVVTEELLRWGAPVGHHWMAERQYGPVIGRFGTEEQKRRFLPGICRGETSFSIGMSEPDAGSDLASLRTKATPTAGGWVLEGTKVWTTGAHLNDWIVVLCRTSEAEDRHEGMSQLIVDLHADGVTARPIATLDGTAEFNEVVFSGVFVPDDLVLGAVGEGWAQNGSELAFERGGPERWLSPYLVLEEFVRAHEHLGEEVGERAAALLGGLVSRLWGIRLLSLAVARVIDAGGSPAAQAALVKDLGTRFEQDVLDGIQGLLDLEPSIEGTSELERLLVRAVLAAPTWTIRGGTNEILRGVIARALGR